MARPENHDQYITSFPEGTAELLQELRETIQATVPEAVEVISYSMPAFKARGKMLAWFAGYERHIGFYPGAAGLAALHKEVSVYKNGKGSVQFPLDQPLPTNLIKALLSFKLQEIAEKLEKKK